MLDDSHHENLIRLEGLGLLILLVGRRGRCIDSFVMLCAINIMIDFVESCVLSIIMVSANILHEIMHNDIAAKYNNNNGDDNNDKQTTNKQITQQHE